MKRNEVPGPSTLRTMRRFTRVPFILALVGLPVAQAHAQQPQKAKVVSTMSTEPSYAIGV